MGGEKFRRRKLNGVHCEVNASLAFPGARAQTRPAMQDSNLPPPAVDLLVVSHTHWDREWYRTAGEFRPRLVLLIDELLDDPGTSPFLLDGQAIVLDDYLALRPERAAELRAALRAGRLEAGPWYVLADELIPSAEGLVRNLLAGRRTLRRLAATAPPVLYSPDAFGHTAALGELASGFGLPVTIVWRGFGGARWPRDPVSRLRSASGAEVLAVRLPPDGYEFGSALPRTVDGARVRWNALRAYVDAFRAAGLDVAWLPNGADHHARQLHLADALAALATVAGPDRVKGASLSELGRRLQAATAGMHLTTARGELRDSYGVTWTLSGTLASRAQQKRALAQLERELVRDVEPWAALVTRATGASWAWAVQAAWAPVRECQPHDSLCGCSTDDVARAVDARLASGAAQAHALRDQLTRRLLGDDPDAAALRPDDWKPWVVVRNCVPYRRSGVVEIDLDVVIDRVRVGPGSGSTSLPAARARTMQLTGASGVQVLARHRCFVREESARQYPWNALVERRRALVWSDDLPAQGLRAFPITGSSTARRGIAMPAHAVDSEIANGILAVRVRDGRVEIDGLRRLVPSVFGFEVTGERGDLYTPSEIPDCRAVARLLRHRLSARGPLRGELTTWWSIRVPARTVESATGEKTRCAARTETVRLRLQLDAGCSFARWVVDGSWSAPNTRLRLWFDTGIEQGTVWADAAFGDVHRPGLLVPPSEQMQERVVTSAPLHRFVSLYGARAGATVFSDGLAEYEAFDHGRLALTLLRGVGELSRNDLPERPGHAGWPVATPDAQSLGPFEATGAIGWHGPRTADTVVQVQHMADDVLLPLEGSTWLSAIAPPLLPPEIVLRGDGLVVGAIKESDDRADPWTVLRCINVLDAPVPGSWDCSGIHEARLARLDETALGVLPVVGGVVSFEARPRGVVTILVR